MHIIICLQVAAEVEAPVVECLCQKTGGRQSRPEANRINALMGAIEGVLNGNCVIGGQCGRASSHPTLLIDDQVFSAGRWFVIQSREEIIGGSVALGAKGDGTGGGGP